MKLKLLFGTLKNNCIYSLYYMYRSPDVLLKSLPLTSVGVEPSSSRLPSNPKDSLKSSMAVAPPRGSSNLA